MHIVVAPYNAGREGLASTPLVESGRPPEPTRRASEGLEFGRAPLASGEPAQQTSAGDRMNPAVSIIIPCLNEKDHIEGALKSIFAQEPLAGGFEVIIADGMSDDGTRDILTRVAKEDSRLRLIDNQERIVSTGLNRAIRQARGSIIIRMDAHTRYAPDYVRRCVETLGATGADNVGGPWVATGTGIVGRAIATAFLSPFSFGGTRGHNCRYEGVVDTVYLGCWPRRVFDRVGLFDEELVRNQDDEFNLRLTRAGGKIWQSRSIKSWYATRDSLRALFRQYLQYGYWKVRVIQKHATPASVRHLIPGVFLLLLIALALGSSISPGMALTFLVLVGAYISCNVAASGLVAARSDWALLPALPLVFACYHFAYGIGFLLGIVDFGILRRTRTSNHAALTR
jgi:succinoglycan biosynthesis protein ExoA